MQPWHVDVTPWDPEMRVCLVLFACLPLALCEVHKFELGDFADAHKLRYDVVNSRPREMSKEEIHKELQLLRQRRSSGQPVNYPWPFNDQHSSGIVQYSGTDQQARDPALTMKGN